DLSNVSFTGDPLFTGSGIVGGSWNGNNAVIHGYLTFAWGYFFGTFSVASNATFNLDGRFGAPTFYGPFTNYGAVNWQNTDLNGVSSPQIYNYGLLNAQSNTTFSGGYGAFNNY